MEQITSKELLEIAKLLIKDIEERGYKTIKFADEDAYYQKIWHKDRTFDGTPEHSLNFVDEDMEALKRLLTDKEEVPTSYDLERFGALFTTLGAVISKGK